VGLVAMGLGFASPAQAATLSASDGQLVVSGLTAGDVVIFCDPNAQFCGQGLYTTTQNGTYVAGSSLFEGDGFTPASLAAGTYNIQLRSGGTTTDQTSINPVIISGGDNGGTSSESTSQPQTVALSINTVDGSSCRQSSVSGIAGTWIDLPASDDCTPPASNAGATLLGWATNPNFPVDIAQRQIDNGWGAYQMFDDEERLTAVFIPAGGPTLLSGDGNLFAIWSE